MEEIKEHSWLSHLKWKDLSQGRMAAPHADHCSRKISDNSDMSVERDFFDNAVEVPLEDCPIGMQQF